MQPSAKAKLGKSRSEEKQRPRLKQRTAGRTGHYVLVAGGSSASPSSAIDKQP
jgi:hypothetical protein